MTFDTLDEAADDAMRDGHPIVEEHQQPGPPYPPYEHYDADYVQEEEDKFVEIWGWNEGPESTTRYHVATCWPGQGEVPA